MNRHMRQVLFGLLSLWVSGCEQNKSALLDSSNPSKSLSSAQPLILTEDGLISAFGQGAGRLILRPTVQVNGQWIKTPSVCDWQEQRLSCLLPKVGTMLVEQIEDHYQLSFEAQSSVTVQAIALEGELQLPGARGWLSQGFQSWSQTGVISFKQSLSLTALSKALAETGEAEVYRRGQGFSWWYSFVGSDQLSFLAGALKAEQFKSYVQLTELDQDRFSLRLVSGAGENLALLPGERVSESWVVALGPELQDHLDRYASSLESRRKNQPTPSLAGWNSWYNLWDDVTEKQLDSQMPRLREFWGNRLPSAWPLTLTVDDGWQENWGDWQPNKKFPSGLQGLAERVNAQSFRFGLWLAPFLVSPESRITREHPEWLVPDIFYANPAGKKFRVLDVTHAGAAEHLQSTVRRLVAAGVQQLKIDFLFAGTFEGKRQKPVTGMMAYREGLRLIREAAGEEVQIVAVGAPPLATFPYVDGWRVGGDIAFKPAFAGLPKPGSNFISNQARSLAGRQAYCQVTLCDADPALLRSGSLPLVDAGIWVAAAAGGALVLSDNLPELASDRFAKGFDKLQVTNGLSGRPARLQSYFPRQIPNDLNNMKDKLLTARAEVPEIWLMPDGTRIGLNLSGKDQNLEGVVVPSDSSRILP